MKRSNVKNGDVAFLYARLSRDDDFEGDSYSIVNQKKLLTKVAKEKGYTKTKMFCDDGYSGVTMNRPQFNEMIEQIKLGMCSAVLVKDLSRLGRNYIEVGRLTEEFFPLYNIRLIAISDNLDTFEGENELAPIKNLFNEWYARDISKKRRISNKIKGSSGEPLCPPPYGYKKESEKSKNWVVDEEAASVVRKIFSLFLDGLGTDQISKKLTQEKILTPSEYAKSKGINRPSTKKCAEPYRWGSSTVSQILSRGEYCGDVINFKTYSISYKNKKRYENNPENIMVFKDVHTPIISREVFEHVQLMRNKSKTRKKQNKNGELNLFSGVLHCSECGSNLTFHYNQKNHNIKYYNCPNNNRGCLKTCYNTHYIRVDYLEKVVLAEIRRLTRFAKNYEDEFVKAVMDYSKTAYERKLGMLQSQTNTLQRRDSDIDSLYEKLYEDNVSGKITDERYSKMSCRYEKEQSEISEKINALKREIDDITHKTDSTSAFVKAVQKYSRIRKLTPRILHELIDYIEVYASERIEGTVKQRIVIHYNCIGSIEIPREVSASDISLDIRKGVTMVYEPAAV